MHSIPPDGVCGYPGAPGERLWKECRRLHQADLNERVLYDALAAGESGVDVAARMEDAIPGPVLRFVKRPLIGPVMETGERVARG